MRSRLPNVEEREEKNNLRALELSGRRRKGGGSAIEIGQCPRSRKRRDLTSPEVERVGRVLGGWVWDGAQCGPFLKALLSVLGRVLRLVASASFGARERCFFEAGDAPNRGRALGGGVWS